MRPSLRWRRSSPVPRRPGRSTATTWSPPWNATPDQVAFVSGQEELQLILAHPFAAWRTFLHPSQREIAYRPSYSGPAQVTGGPGTGKTVTVLHRAAFLAARAASAPEPTGPGAAGASAPMRHRSC